jgi:hypothetical protein
MWFLIHVPEHLRSIVANFRNQCISDGIHWERCRKITNFENFKELKRLASDEELLALIHNKNRIVAVYSAIGLLDRKPEVLDKFFLIF